MSKLFLSITYEQKNFRGGLLGIFTETDFSQQCNQTLQFFFFSCSKHAETTFFFVITTLTLLH